MKKRSWGVLGLATITIAANAVTSAPSASATDLFTLNKNSTWQRQPGWQFEGAILYNSVDGAQCPGTNVNADQCVLPTPCVTNPSGADVLPGNRLSPGQSFTVALDDTLGCGSTTFEVDYGLSLIPPYDWVFTADNPEAWSASLGCEATGYAANYIVADLLNEVNGALTCDINDLPAAIRSKGRTAHVRIASTLARLKNGDANVRIALSANRKLRVNERIEVIQPRSGKTLAQVTSRLQVGRPRTVQIPLSKAVRRAVARAGEMLVRVVVRHADGTRGTGDELRVLLRKM